MKRFISHGLECAVLEGPLGNLNGYVIGECENLARQISCCTFG
jgi:hypothetical protein